MLLFPLVAVAQVTSAATAPVARTPLQNYVTPDDYPQGVPRMAARAVELTLIVGPDGRVAECRVTMSSGNANLDSMTCGLMRSRARFTPAVGAGGTPIAGEVKAVIDWKAMLDSTSPAPVVTQPVRAPQLVPRAAWESTSRLRVQRGQISNCQWQGGLVPPPPSSNACQNFGLASLALRLAVENKVNFNKSEVVVTLRLPDGVALQPLKPNPAALVDLSADLDINAEGGLTSCRFTRDSVRSASPQKPDCQLLFAGPYVKVTDRSGKAVASKNVAELRVEVR